MQLQHKVDIRITKPNGEQQEVLKGGSRTIYSRLLNYLLGERMNVLVISPGNSVRSVEIHEVVDDAR